MSKFFYLQLNGDRQVIGACELGGPVESEALLPVDSYRPDLIGKIEDGGLFIDPPVLTTASPADSVVRHITPRAFVARLRSWWPLIEHLKTNSADFRLDWLLLEMAGYVDLDDAENLETLQRLKTAVDALAATAEFASQAIPPLDLTQLLRDGSPKEAFNV